MMLIASSILMLSQSVHGSWCGCGAPQGTDGVPAGGIPSRRTGRRKPQPVRFHQGEIVQYEDRDDVIFQVLATSEDSNGLCRPEEVHYLLNRFKTKKSQKNRRAFEPMWDADGPISEDVVDWKIGATGAVLKRHPKGDEIQKKISDAMEAGTYHAPILPEFWFRIIQDGSDHKNAEIMGALDLKPATSTDETGTTEEPSLPESDSAGPTVADMDKLAKKITPNPNDIQARLLRQNETLDIAASKTVIPLESKTVIPLESGVVFLRPSTRPGKDKPMFLHPRSNVQEREEK